LHRSNDFCRFAAHAAQNPRTLVRASQDVERQRWIRSRRQRISEQMENAPPERSRPGTPRCGFPVLGHDHKRERERLFANPAFKLAGSLFGLRAAPVKANPQWAAKRMQIAISVEDGKFVRIVCRSGAEKFRD